MGLRKRKQSASRLPEDIPLADYGADENITDNVKIQWVNQPWVRTVLRGAAIISFISVCLNTPKTFKTKIGELGDLEFLRYVTLVVDSIVTLLLALEMVAKMHMRGIFKGDNAYWKDHWCIFDGIMVIFHIISLIIHVIQIADPDKEYTPWAILRCPRPLIMIRAFRIYLKFQLPKARVKSIFKRSGQQVWSVTIFFTFFMVLYGMLGVQWFGELNSHCILSGQNKTKFGEEVVQYLAIPDTYCNDNESCPDKMKCSELELPEAIAGYNSFSDIGVSIFTVYESASLEGWVFIMYKVIDSFPSWSGYFFFITMIFFLAWLVKNVFIAVIIETFAEIRVQFRQMYQAKATASGFMNSKVLQDEGTCTPWKLMPIGEGKRPRGLAPPCFQAVLSSRGFHVVILLLVVLDAILMSTYNMFFEFKSPAWVTYDTFLDWAQVTFTLLFDLEVLFKVWCLGFQGFIKRSLHKFDLVLAIGNTIRVIFYKELKASQLCYFQVLRTFRLIKLFPTLEDFARRIFGHIVKLGTLVLFTLSSLILISVISLQLFCCIEGLRQFETFPHAFMSMFQILTQKGWAIVMYQCMLQGPSQLAFPIAAYFITYHLFATVIVLSLFVAVILDNLELNEDHKTLKQLQASQEKADKKRIPLRLRIFENFPDKPQMVTLKRVPSEFSLPKIRDSFIRQFVETGNDMERLLKRSINREVLQALPSPLSPSNYLSPGSPLKLLRKRVAPVKSHGHDQIQKKTGVHSIVRESAHQRVLSLGFGAVGYRGRMLSEYGSRDRRALRSSVRGHKPLEQIKENGEVTNRNVSLNIKVIQERRQQAAQKRTAKEEELRENHPYFDKPLFAVGRESRIRKICTAIIYARYNTTSTDAAGMVIKQRYQEIRDFLGMVTYLTWCSILMTVLSCFWMMKETPHKRMTDPTETSLVVMEIIFVAFMSIEMILKVLADGMFFTPKALIHDVGGILDVFIYITSLVFLCWRPEKIPQGSLAHYFMVLRCCRPLRIFTLVPHLRKLGIELLGGFWDIFLVSILLLSLTFMFASYGVQAFAGELLKCNDPSITNLADCKGEFEQTVSVVRFLFKPENESVLPKILVPRVIANPRNFNFDNLWNALLALFEVLSLEGWLEVRDIIIEETSSGLNAIYIHVFVFCGCMIGLTLFVGVVIANYFENKGTSLLTIDQRRWQDLKGRLALAQPLHLPPRPDYSRVRARLYDITQHKYFKRLIAFLVLINFFMLSFKWATVPEERMEGKIEPRTKATSGLVWISVFLTFLFVVEVILKCISLSPLGYWHSRRNRYDLFVTILGVIWIGLLLTRPDYHLSYIVGVFVTFFRFFSITGKHPTLKMLMMTIGVSMMKSLFIIFGLYLLIIFYAFTGVVLFGNVKYGEMLGRHANFQTATNAQAALFRIVTGEDWNKIMHDCMISHPLCSTRFEGNFWQTDCGNATASLIYFGSFYVVIAYIVLNLLVAIIMENFSLFYSNEEDALLSYADIKNFQITWNMVDIHRKGVIPVSRVKFVLRLLRGRLEVDMEKDNLLYKHMCCEIEKMRNGQDVTFHDVLSMLSYRSVDIRKSLQLDELMAREELEYSIEEEVAKDTIRYWLEKCLKRMRAKERAANPRGLITKLGGDEFEAPTHLMIPDFIEPVSTQEVEEEEEEDDTTNQAPETQPSSQQKSDSASTSPGHKLLVPTLSEGGARPDGEDLMAGGRRRSTRSSTSSPSVTPQSSSNSIPAYPQAAKQTGSSSASKEVQDWWKEQLHYDSGSEED